MLQISGCTYLIHLSENHQFFDNSLPDYLASYLRVASIKQNNHVSIRVHLPKEKEALIGDGD